MSDRLHSSAPAASNTFIVIVRESRGPLNESSPKFWVLTSVPSTRPVFRSFSGGRETPA